MKITFTYTNDKQHECNIPETVCQQAARKLGYNQLQGLADTSESYLAQYIINQLKQAADNNVIDQAVATAKASLVTTKLEIKEVKK